MEDNDNETDDAKKKRNGKRLKKQKKKLKGREENRHPWMRQQILVTVKRKVKKVR